MALAIVTFIEGWINTPAEPIPEPSSADSNDKDEDKTPADDEGKNFLLSDVKSSPIWLENPQNFVKVTDSLSNSFKTLKSRDSSFIDKQPHVLTLFRPS